MKYAQYDSEGNIIGFYDTAIHSQIPPDTVPITEDQWLACISDQGKYRVNVDHSGLELAPPLAPPTDAELRNRLRPERDARIHALQDRVDRYNNQVVGGFQTVDTPEIMGQIYVVMQLLRDFIATCPDPANPVWPEAPAEPTK